MHLLPRVRSEHPPNDADSGTRTKNEDRYTSKRGGLVIAPLYQEYSLPDT
jgi:hypothetical protein